RPPMPTLFPYTTLFRSNYGSRRKGGNSIAAGPSRHILAAIGTPGKGNAMELGLLYEFDVPQPWAGEHPWGQRTAERLAYENNIKDRKSTRLNSSHVKIS